MKRKLFLLTAIILSLSLFLTACGQKDIGEAKAKEIGLAYINQVFDANETEATVMREQRDCYSDQVGAMATTGNAELTTRWLYVVTIPMSDSMMKYEIDVVASTGEVIDAWQNEANIVLNNAQKEKANKLAAAETNWGEKHNEAVAEMEQICNDWATTNLDETRPIVLSLNHNLVTNEPITTTFSDWFYVITRDGRVYWIIMQWPSLQILSISSMNAK